jgi:RNA polymerase sigma-70 factor (ECF subfamily)
MGNIGLSSQGMVRFGASSSQDDRPSAGFEELAMPLFDSLYNFANWLVQNRSAAEDLVQDSEDDVPVLPATSATPESLLIERGGNDAVQCAIEQLPVILREVILLCDVEDASYREIAEILSIPIGTVMSRLARARKTVRKTVRGEEIFREAAL